MSKKKKKLSPSARKLYASMKAGVNCYLMPMYVFRGDNFQKVTTAAKALLAAGLIRETRPNSGEYEVCLDDKEG